MYYFPELLDKKKTDRGVAIGLVSKWDGYQLKIHQWRGADRDINNFALIILYRNYVQTKESKGQKSATKL